MKTNKIRSICVYTYTIYTYMHHQIPTKMIYLVDLPSVLYERPGQNERPVLNQLFLLFFRCFSCTFHEKHHWFHTKSATFNENQQDQVNMCVYMYHLYIHAPPNQQHIMIYLVDLPCVLYERPGQNKRPVLNQLIFVAFQIFSGDFHIFFIKNTTVHTKSGNV